jgi:hypothetical protein
MFGSQDHERFVRAEPGLLMATSRAIFETLPWGSTTATKANDQDNTAITTAATDYYTVDSRFRPPDVQRATGPSAQTLIQGIFKEWTEPQPTPVALTKQCGLLADVIIAGGNVTDGLSVRWEPDTFLQRMINSIAQVSGSTTWSTCS